MRTLIDPLLDTIDGLIGYLSSAMGQLAENYCAIETADSRHCLVARDGSLASIVKIEGATYLVGPAEFDRIHQGLSHSLQASLARQGHALQVYFYDDKEMVERDLEQILFPATQTAERLKLNLNDVFKERVEYLKQYCSSEALYFVLWTRPNIMTKTQSEQSSKEKIARVRAAKAPPFSENVQNFLSAIPEMRDSHDSFVRATLADLQDLGLAHALLDVHAACQAIRFSVDPDFTHHDWRPYLPGDPIPIRETQHFKGEISDVLWPSLKRQLIPRDGQNLDARTCRIGDRIYSTVFIDLFPQDIAPFGELLNRVRNARTPWRISFMIESGGLEALGFKTTLASFLSFAHSNNKLITKSADLLKYLQVNTDDAIVKLRVCASTWAKEDEVNLLRTRTAELAKAIQGWGYCETSENCGDAFSGALSSNLGLSTESAAITAVAPLSDVVYMLPCTRPASPWTTGAVLFRSIDGKPWPYQPGSSQQTTWIDLVYARPGSGKSVLSNAINLALSLSAGITRLPHIAIIDIGPSSSGLISLIKEALPDSLKYLAAYHRLRMTPNMAINPFDTQLGCRFPTPQERAFLVNFLTLLATPVGQAKPYDGITDMAGMIVDELYKELKDDGNPHRYTANLDITVDAIIKEQGIQLDPHSTWWEVTDALFKLGFIHEALLAQRYAVPLLADAASICRTQAVEDLYGNIKAPTGESLINAFGRMISSAVREYPILSRVTVFDIGDARIVSLDLDEVAKSGGEAADRQTAVMYMLARYVLARHYYLNEDAAKDMPELYRNHHLKRILEIREDPKRIVFDEFHRTSKAQAVREQVIVDMREGRKWKVQVALLSQSLDDFDSVMVEFATSIFIMDAGPKQAVERSCQVFGLSDTARIALETKVHGPRAGGATFLAQFATKQGINTQLLTSTIGPNELWAFNTTAEDTRIRNALYDKIGARNARKILSLLYPTGSATRVIEERLNQLKAKGSLITDEESSSIIQELIAEILAAHQAQPVSTLPE